MENMKQNVGILASGQAVLFIGHTLIITTGSLVAMSMEGAAMWATLPLGLIYLTTVITIFPASMLMKRIGRKHGFMLAMATALIGAGLCLLGVINGNFTTFCLGAVGLGVWNAFGQYLRFAAVDASTEEFQSKAVSWVIAGGIVAAIVGPNLVLVTNGWFENPFAGAYAGLMIVYVIGIAIFTRLQMPPVQEEELTGEARPLMEIAMQPTFIVAALGAMIGYGVMSLVMTATPMAMHGSGHGVGGAAMVISWHVLAMFIPAFFTGSLIARFGVLNVMLAGGVFIIGCITLNFVGTQMMHYSLALLLLGIGWNFLFIGATTLLPDAYTPAEKAKAQGLNDLLVFSTVAITATTSGVLLHNLGWRAVNIGVIPLLFIAMVAIFWLKSGAQKTPTPAAT